MFILYRHYKRVVGKWQLNFTSFGRSKVVSQKSLEILFELTPAKGYCYIFIYYASTTTEYTVEILFFASALFVIA